MPLLVDPGTALIWLTTRLPVPTTSVLNVFFRKSVCRTVGKSLEGKIPKVVAVLMYTRRLVGGCFEFGDLFSAVYSRGFTADPAYPSASLWGPRIMAFFTENFAEQFSRGSALQ